MTTWRTATLGEEIELRYGRALPERSRHAGPVQVFGSNGVVGTHVEASVVGPGIVVGRKGSVGEVAYASNDFWPIDTTYYVVPKRDHNWRFLYHLLRYCDLTELNSHSTIPGLNREDAYKIEVSLPDRTAEDDLASVLDWIERAARLESDALTRTERLKAAAMQQLFSQGLRGEAQKQTEIGPIPDSWELRSIPDLCDIWSGGTPKKSNPDYWNGDIPWVSGKDLKRPALDDASDHVSQSGVDVGSRLAPTDSVLLLVRGMGLAKDLPVAVITRPMAFNQDVKALVSKHGYPGSFLRSAIFAGKDRLLSQLATSAHGTKTLNLHDLSNFVVPTPPSREEAQEVAEVLEALDRKTNLHDRKREVLDQLFKSLLHKLMTGEVSVDDLDLSALPKVEGSAA